MLWNLRDEIVTTSSNDTVLNISADTTITTATITHAIGDLTISGVGTLSSVIDTKVDLVQICQLKQQLEECLVALTERLQGQPNGTQFPISDTEVRSIFRSYVN